jgi:hypothetical protein
METAYHGLLQALDVFDDARKRQVVARLRQQYGEARALVSRVQPYAHLEWILGMHRDLERDDAAFETGVSELIVLWLQDLAVELDSGVAPQDSAGSEGGGIAPSSSRQAVAESLRNAAREFAAAFLSPS